MSEVQAIQQATPILARAYALVAELWCNPTELDIDQVVAEGRAMVKALCEVEPNASSLLERFLTTYPPAEEEYVDLFELNPRCPLYLGSHAFEEPKTCAQAAISDRNEYMLELMGIYRHFGFSLKERELPDFLPPMVEFLALTADSEDSVRQRLIEEYLLPFLPQLACRLQALESPYADLLDALERLLRLDVKVHREGIVADAG